MAVVDLAVKDDDLVLATRGRSLWILDDYSPLRTPPAQLAARPQTLFPPRPAVRWELTRGWSRDGAADNPPDGAILHYHLAEPASGEVTLEVLAADGTLVRRLSSVAEPAAAPPDDPDEPTPEPKAALATTAGLHRVVWDLEHAGARRLAQVKVDLGDPTTGPRAIPGTYTLRLTDGERRSETTLELLPDPRLDLAPAALAEQLAFALEIRDALDRAGQAIDTVRAIRAQAADLVAKLADRTDAGDVPRLAQAVIERADALEAELHNPRAEVTYDILAQRGGTQLHSNLAFLFETARWGTGTPTQGAREVWAELVAELATREAELAALRSGEVAALESAAERLGLPRIVLPASPAPTHSAGQPGRRADAAGVAGARSPPPGGAGS